MAPSVFIASKEISQTLNEPLLFASEESVGPHGEAIFNEVAWQQQGRFDIWRMKQSHNGLHAKPQAWDQLAIIVDRENKTVSYHQLVADSTTALLTAPPDSLHPWPQKDYRVSCYSCHANGPRHLRPNWNSSELSLGWQSKLKVNWLNQKMQRYGRLKIIEHSPFTQSIERQRPLALTDPFASQPLLVKICQQCHSESGDRPRGPLQRQHLYTIQFMLKNKYMPPKGHSLSAQEKSQLENFMAGF